MDWEIAEKPVEYLAAVTRMEARVADIRAGSAPELVWLLEHPPLYTAGTSANAADLIDPKFPVYDTGRGGQYTYHGPGQWVGYVMMDLTARQKTPDVRQYVRDLEEWIIQTLAAAGVKGERRDGRIGIWVDVNGADKKIAAIGVRIRHGVTYHGISLNVDPDLSHFSGIVPCGLSDFGVTSLHDLGVHLTMAETAALMRKSFFKG